MPMGVKRLACGCPQDGYRRWEGMILPSAGKVARYCLRIILDDFSAFDNEQRPENRILMIMENEIRRRIRPEM